MFSTNHIIWLILCTAVITGALTFLNRRRPPLKSVLTFACIASLCSELIKQFSMIRLIPSADGSMMFPYIELAHLPLHLCSLQILLIFYARFARESRVKEAILAFMYPTCSMGAFLALLMPSIFPDSIDVSQAFTHPLAYQYFLFHCMLVVLGLYIALSGQVALRSRHYFSTLGILGLLAILSLYLNSMFASPLYENGVLKSVDFTTNFFFTYQPPIDIPFTQIWHWYLYFGVIVTLAVVLIALFYIPFFKRDLKNK